MSFLKKIDAFVNDLFCKDEEQVKPKVCYQQHPVWGKEGEWVPFNNNTNLPLNVKVEEAGDRRVFHIDVGNCSPEEAEALMKRVREKFKEQKCCKEAERADQHSGMGGSGCCSLPLVEEDLPEAEDVVELDAVDDLYFTKGTGDLKTILLVHVSVGALPPHKAEAHVQRAKERYQGLFERLPSNVGVMFVASRTQDTYVEMLPVSYGNNCCDL